MGCSKSSSKREVYSNPISRNKQQQKKLNRQSDFTPKTTLKRMKTTTITKK